MRKKRFLEKLREIVAKKGCCDGGCRRMKSNRIESNRECVKNEDDDVMTDGVLCNLE